MRTTLLVAALLATPAAALSQSDVDFKTTNQQAISEYKLGVRDWLFNSADQGSLHFAAALKADPNFGLARALWAFFGGLPTANRNAELDRAVTDAAAHGSDNEVILALAAREFANSRPKVGAALFRAAATLRPSDRLAEFLSTVDLSGSERLAAQRDFTTRHPEYAFAYNTLAFSSWDAGDRTAALAAAKKQIELEPTSSNAHDSYAHLLQWTGDFDAAKSHYLQAVKLPSPYPGSYGGLAEIASLQGKFDEARVYLSQAIAASYTTGEKLGYMQQVAGTYALQGTQVDALVKQLESIAAAAKADGRAETAAEAYGQIAAVEATAGNADAAHKYATNANSTAGAGAWWPHYYVAVAHGLLKHWGPANAELSTLKGLANSRTDVSKDHVAAAEGMLLTQQGKPADALKVLMTADTTNFIVMNRIAEAHAALGHAAEATAWNKRIIDNYNVGLADFPGVNARRRAREGIAAGRR